MKLLYLMHNKFILPEIYANVDFVQPPQTQSFREIILPTHKNRALIGEGLVGWSVVWFKA